MSIQPSCFGKSWDPNHVECKGGLDPAYSNPRTGTKLRDECSWFNACRQQVQSRPSMPLLPSAALLQRPAVSQPLQRPPAPPTQYAPRAPTYSAPPVHYSLPSTPSYPTPQAAPAAQQFHPQVMSQQNYVPAHVAQYGPAYVPMPYQNPGSQMPQYLTVPEPVTDDVHWAVRLGRELFRSIVKAFGHQLAAHVDSHSFEKHNRQ